MNAIQKPARRGPRILLALLLGAAAAGGVYLYVGNIQQSAQQATRQAVQQAQNVPVARAKVMVAKQTLAAQTALTADNVELREVPSDAVQPNAVTSLGEVQGRALTVPVAAGQQ